jgi:hypothetical protein
MSKKRAFVRYSKQGKIVPGSLILTAGSFPQGPSIWNEVPADLLSINSVFPSNPASYTTTVKSQYTSAVSALRFAEAAKEFIKTQGYNYKDILVSTDVCSDDVNAVEHVGNLGQTSAQQSSFLGPFFGAGLAGFPHTGVLGLQAWASHITTNGALFLVNMPHIGISQVGNVGRMWRKGKTQAQSLTDNTCGAVVTAAQWVMTNLAGGPTPVRGAGVFANNDQFFTLATILWANRATLCSAPYNFVLDPTKYGAGVKLATEYIRVASDTFLTGASGIITANVGANVDVFYCNGTFINVDHGYNAYVEVTTFKKYNSVSGWTDLTVEFQSIL